jgi:hypothetical protein
VNLTDPYLAENQVSRNAAVPAWSVNLIHRAAACMFDSEVITSWMAGHDVPIPWHETPPCPVHPQVWHRADSIL